MLLLELHTLFPTVIATDRLMLDPLVLAAQLQTLMGLRGQTAGHSVAECAWTGDLNGVRQLHQHDDFQGLASLVIARVCRYLEATGFDVDQLDLHLQRCWPTVSEWGQVVGRHHHPNAHLSAVLYLSGNGSGDEGELCLHTLQQLNELVPGLAVGHDGPIAAGHPHNQRVWTLAAEPGLLVLFPSRLEHSITENGDEEGLRVSVCFNFALTARAVGQPPEYLSPHPQQRCCCARPTS